MAKIGLILFSIIWQFSSFLFFTNYTQANCSQFTLAESARRTHGFPPTIQALEWGALPEFNRQTFALYHTVVSTFPSLPVFLPEWIAQQIIQDVSRPLYVQNLNKVLALLLKTPENQPLFSRLKSAVRQTLEGRVPEDTIDSRLDFVFSRPTPGRLQWAQALGEMSQEETSKLLFGTNLKAPNPRSLIGQYLAETGAAWGMRRFRTGITEASGLGPARLVIAVSAQSFNEYLKLVRRPEFLMHLHTPQQGTLLLAHNGKSGHYGKLRNDPVSLPAIGTLAPLIVFSTAQGQLATRFFELASTAGHGRTQSALQPWLLTGPEGAYCATGGYDSCTHWFGNIPVGEVKVDSYRFPGNVDEHAGNAPSTGVQKQKLQPFTVEPDPARSPAENAAFDRLVHEVWKVPGHQQLADLIGLGKQNVKGELASPGYVLVSLTGSADLNYVPVVFVFVQNHRDEIPQQIDRQANAF